MMCLIVFTGYLVATSGPMRKGLARLVSITDRPAHTVAWVGFLSMALAWVNWGLGLIAAAVILRTVIRRGTRVDHRLLAAAAYFGLGTTWHAGLSGSVPLLLATKGHFLEATTGVIPVAETIFSPVNLGFTAVVLAVMPMVAFLMHPRSGEEICMLPPERAAAIEEFTPPARPGPGASPAQVLEHSPYVNIFLGACGLAWAVDHFIRQGLALDLNTVNLIFLSFGVLMHWTPASLGKASSEAAGLLHGIVLQFPLYAGMYGVIKGSGLAQRIADWFVSVSTGSTFPTMVVIYSAILNYFVPSGGSKWAIEAPYLLDAASRMGVGVKTVALSYAYGDMATNIIQPFWAIPIMAASGLKFREIMGYGLIVLAVYLPLACLTGFFCL